MGCCAGIKQEISKNKDVLITTKQNENINYSMISNGLSKEKQIIAKNVADTKHENIPSINIDANCTDNSFQTKHRKNIKDNNGKRIKHTSNNLKQLSKNEVKNIHKFFA